MWEKEYFKLFLTDRRVANKIKLENIPLLYKFQPFQDFRVESLKNDEFWLSTPDKMNDPFDCLGLHWDYDNIVRHLSKNPKASEDISKEDIIGLVKSHVNHTRLTCFTSDLHNQPMWAHYADQHKGFCVEYDFRVLDVKDEMLTSLNPVGYESKKYDITNILKLSIDSALGEEFDPRTYLMYLLLLIKHTNWSYEKEWRILQPTDDGKSGLLKSKVKPTAIYLGMNFDTSQIDVIKRAVNCPIYIMKMASNESFELEYELVKQ